MFGNRRGRQAQHFHNLAHADFAALQSLHHTHSLFVRQRLGNGHDLTRLAPVSAFADPPRRLADAATFTA